MSEIECRPFWMFFFVLFCVYYIPKDVGSLIVFFWLLSMAVKSKDVPGDIASLLRQ